MVLTEEGRDLLKAHRHDRDEGDGQAFYAGINRPRELDHDSHLYAVYREEEARIRQEHDSRAPPLPLDEWDPRAPSDD